MFSRPLSPSTPLQVFNVTCSQNRGRLGTVENLCHWPCQDFFYDPVIDSLPVAGSVKFGHFDYFLAHSPTHYYVVTSQDRESCNNTRVIFSDHPGCIVS